MDKEKTKSQQIRALYDGVRTTRDIANLVGCRPSYVRVVARQRKGGVSEIDKRYTAKPRVWALRTAYRTKWLRKNSERVRALARLRYLLRKQETSHAQD